MDEIALRKQPPLPGFSGKSVKTKKQITVGKEKYINSATGAVEEFTVITKNINQDFNFHKIWLQDLLNILDSFGNKKIAVLNYLLKKMRNEDNTISATYRMIAEQAKVSTPTVTTVMRELIDSNVIRKICTGTYQFNPDLIVKGGSDKRQKLLVQYFQLDEEINRGHDVSGEIAEKLQGEVVEVEIAVN